MKYPNLSPEMTMWIEMATSQVVRHMDGHPLVPVSLEFAKQAVRQKEAANRRQSATVSRRLGRETKPTGPLSAIEKQVLAGVELELSVGALARNLGVSVTRVDEIMALLRKRGVL